MNTSILNLGVSEEVVNYIRDLRNNFSEGAYVARMYYTRGGCCEFAVKLKQRFPKGKLAVTHEFQHVLFAYDGIYYDVDGVYDEEEIMAEEEELVPTALKLINAFQCDIKTLRPNSDGWMAVMKNFTNREIKEFEDFCYNHECYETLEELDRALDLEED